MVEWVGSWIRDRGLAEADAGKVENMGGKSTADKHLLQQ